MTDRPNLYPGDEGETWREYRRLVLQELKQLRADISTLSQDSTRNFAEIRSELVEFKTRLAQIEKDLEKLQQHEREAKERPLAPPSWQERILTPPVLMAAILGACVIVALLLGRNDAIKPLIEAVPTP